MYEKTLKNIRIIHAALVIGPSLLGLVLVFVARPSSAHVQKEIALPMLMAITFVVVVFSVLGYVLKRKKIQLIPHIVQENSKLAEFTTANIILFSMLEGPALFAWTSYQVTGSNYSIAMALLMTVQLLGVRPTRKRMERELGIFGNEG
jgi:hypothetical protein